MQRLRHMVVLGALALCAVACRAECDGHSVPHRCFDDTDCFPGTHCDGVMCVSSASPGRDAGGDAAGSPAPFVATDYFVLTSLTVDDSDAIDFPHTGFNLDGLASGPTDSDGCNHEDMYSALDRTENEPGGCQMGVPGCRGGVDNQYPTLFNSVQAATMGSELRMLLRAAVERGEFVYVIAIDGSHPRADGSTVSVALLSAHVASGLCLRPADPGALLVIDARSYVNGDPQRPRWRVAARVDGTRIRATESMDAPMRLPVPSQPPGMGPWVFGGFAELPATRVRLAFDVSGDGAAITRGNWGGAIRGNDILQAWAHPSWDFFVQVIVSGVVDVRTRCAFQCVDRSVPSSPVFGDMSVGLGFDGRRARVLPVDPSPPADAACGDAAVDP